MARILVVALTCLLAACGGDRTRKVPTTPPDPDPTCGDGFIDEGEQCDGSDLADQSCQSQGFDLGTLLCGSDCQFVTTQCVKFCGNGQLDPGETCDGTVGPLACGKFGVKTCTAACQIDERTCVDVPYEAGPVFEGNPGGEAVLTDVTPKGRADLVLAVPLRARVEIYPWNASTGFLDTNKRPIASEGTPVLAYAAELSGDTSVDIAAIHQDGSVSRFVSTGEAFAENTILNSGCPAAEFRGVLPPVESPRLVVLGCRGTESTTTYGAVLILKQNTTPSTYQSIVGDFLDAAVGDVTLDGVPDVLVLPNGSGGATIYEEGATEWEEGESFMVSATGIELADLDGDGDLDLIATTGANVELFERTVDGFASKNELTGAGIDLIATDLDRDGRTDLVWREGATLEIRRNQGDFTFSSHTLAFMGTDVLSLNVGDVDGDLDADLVVTDRVGDQLTNSTVFLNQIR